MSEEELINYFQEKIDNGNHKIFTDISDIEYKAIDAISCITNLQQENTRLQEQYCERTDCAGRIGCSKKVERLENGLKEVREYVRFINPAHYSSENEIKILKMIDKALED